MAIATIERPETKQARRLKWSVPRWSMARELRKVAPIVFGIWPIVRIIVISLIIGAGLCVAAKLAVPQIQLAFAWKALFAIPTMFAYLGTYFAIRLLVPSQVKITEKYILYSTGQSAWRIDLSDIDSSKLVVYSPQHIRLIIRAKGRARKLAVPATVDLQQLTSLLSSTVVFNKRAEFQTARAFVKALRLPNNAD